MKQWAGVQLQADTVLQEERLVKTSRRKTRGVSVECCHIGGFSGHIMCHFSSGFDSEATSFLPLCWLPRLFLSVRTVLFIRKKKTEREEVDKPSSVHILPVYLFQQQHPATENTLCSEPGSKKHGNVTCFFSVTH